MRSRVVILKNGTGSLQVSLMDDILFVASNIHGETQRTSQRVEARKLGKCHKTDENPLRDPMTCRDGEVLIAMRVVAL